MQPSKLSNVLNAPIRLSRVISRATRHVKETFALSPANSLTDTASRSRLVLARHQTIPSSKKMAPVNKTLTVLAVAGVGALAYAIYFDHRRRSDPKFRKQLRKSNFVFVGLLFTFHPGREKKKLEKSAAQTDTSTSASGGDSGELPTAEILAAMARIKDDQVPTTPEEREKYFMAQVEKGEQLCAIGACTR